MRFSPCASDLYNAWGQGAGHRILASLGSGAQDWLGTMARKRSAIGFPESGDPSEPGAVMTVPSRLMLWWAAVDSNHVPPR
jgi:hypothetical protein